jgi:hypothetical protein
MGLARPRRDGDTLQQLRSALPTEVRVTATTHPLFGRLLATNGFKRRDGVLLLMVILPDGSPGTIPAGATDILGGPAPEPGTTVLSVEGLRRLRQLAVALSPPVKSRRRTPRRK